MGGRLAHWYRPAMLGQAAAIAVFAGALAQARFGAFAAIGAVGIDYRTFVVFGNRLLSTGSMYLPEQLAGPYPAQPVPHVPASMPSLYPPPAGYVFAAATVLPPILWWAVTLGVLAVVAAAWRPRPWTWPVLALIACHPAVPSTVIVGGSSMWVAAAVAAGLWLGWPAALVLLKPNLAVFALGGLSRPRSFLAGLVVLALVSIPLLGEWARYPAVVANRDAASGYLPFEPIVLLPVVAWLGRSGRAGARAAAATQGTWDRSARNAGGQFAGPDPALGYGMRQRGHGSAHGSSARMAGS